MNAETKILADQKCQPGLDDAAIELLGVGLNGLRYLAEKQSALAGLLEALAKTCDRPTAKRARKLIQKLDSATPAVTMIGQVKAGKTSLVNAMVGWPGLLPSDVNPWTSVVTSLFLDPAMHPAQNSSSFQFFDDSEWDRLVVGGGRVGELARRAGAMSELEQVSRQVEEMREKSRQRLGRKFELLLGQQHDYGYFDADLIERYVCLGDDFEDDTETSMSRGRFADITKSAKLSMHSAVSPTKLCIRDTPGVNDTFLVREQITIRAIRESRICVVVLAAHQALSSIDLALIRLISNVKSREVIIFINRIDELEDPAMQVPEIRASIQATLRDHQGPEDAAIIFGSAVWANQVLEGQMNTFSAESTASLLNYARAELHRIPAGTTPRGTIWELSGVPDLHRALAERILEGPGAEVLSSVARSARNLACGVKISSVGAASRKNLAATAPKDPAALIEEFHKIESESLHSLESELTKLCEAFLERIDRVHTSFLDRATASLIAHLEQFGPDSVWKYDPTGLRVLLRSSYQTFAKRSRDLTEKVLAATAADSAAFFERAFSLDPGACKLDPPAPPAAPAPIILGQTIALDLQTNWWTTWWRKQTDIQSYAREFSEMIAAETAPIFQDLNEQHALPIRDDAAAALGEFLAEQKQVFEGLLNHDETSGTVLPGFAAQDQRAQIIEQSIAALDAFLDKTDG